MKKQLLALLFILGAVFNINADYYQRVTSLSDISSNDEYIFVSENQLTKSGVSSLFVLSTFAGTNSTRTSSTEAISGITTPKDILTPTEVPTIAKISIAPISETGYYSLYSIDKSVYLGTKSATALKSSATLDGTSKNYQMSLSFNESGGLIITPAAPANCTYRFGETSTNVFCRPFSDTDTYAKSSIALYKVCSGDAPVGPEPSTTDVQLSFGSVPESGFDTSVGSTFNSPSLKIMDKEGNNAEFSDLEIVYGISSTPAGAFTINETTGVVTVNAKGTATITASVKNTDKYTFTSTSYKLTAYGNKTTFIVNGGGAILYNSNFGLIQNLNEGSNNVDLSDETNKTVYIYAPDDYELVSVENSNGAELSLTEDYGQYYASFTADEAACALSYTITVKKPVVLTKFTVTGGSAILYNSNYQILKNLTEGEQEVDLSAADNSIVYIYPAEGYELVSVVNDFEKALDLGTDVETRFASLTVNDETRRREYTVTVRTPQTEPEGVKFTLTEGSAAEIWKYSGGTMSKWKALSEEENIVDFSNEYQWGNFYIMPAEGQILKSIIDENGDNVSFSTGSALSGRNTFYSFSPGNLGKSYTITTQKEITTIDFIVTPGSKALLYAGTRLIQELNEGSNPIDIRSYTQACYIYAAEGYELTSVVRRNQDGSDTQQNCDTEDLGSYIAGLYSYSTVNTTLERQAVSYTITTKKLGGDDDDEIGDIVGPFTAMFNFSDLESLKEMNGTTYTEGSWFYTDHTLVINENKGVKLTLSSSEQFGADHLIMRGATEKFINGSMQRVPGASLIISQNHANIYITAVEIVYADGNTGAFTTADKGILSNNGTSWIDELPAEANGPVYATPQGKITSVSLTPESQTLVKGVNVTYMSTTTGIEEINTEANDAEPVYFDLQGRRVKNPGNGLYIRVIGNKADKVVIR